MPELYQQMSYVSVDFTTRTETGAQLAHARRWIPPLSGRVSREVACHSFLELCRMNYSCGNRCRLSC